MQTFRKRRAGLSATAGLSCSFEWTALRSDARFPSDYASGEQDIISSEVMLLFCWHLSKLTEYATVRYCLSVADYVSWSKFMR